MENFVNPQIIYLYLLFVWVEPFRSSHPQHLGHMQSLLSQTVHPSLCLHFSPQGSGKWHNNHVYFPNHFFRFDGTFRRALEWSWVEKAFFLSSLYNLKLILLCESIQFSYSASRHLTSFKITHPAYLFISHLKLIIQVSEHIQHTFPITTSSGGIQII